MFSKFVLLLLVVIFLYSVDADDDPCNSGSFNSSTASGVLPYQYKDLVQIPNGTVCVYNFTIPYGYALQLKTDYYLTSQDKITITNNINEQIVYNAFGAAFENIYFCPKGFCQVKVESVSKASFMTFFKYTLVSNYTSTTVYSGDWNQLSDIKPGQCIIYYCSNCVFTLEKFTGLASKQNLKNYYVYNGPGLTSFEYIATLDTLRTQFLYTTVVFVTIVNFYDGFDSDAYIIANDASQIPNDYSFILTSPENMESYQFSSYINNEAAVTFGCKGCDRYYLAGVTFDTSVASNGYAAIQGQSPSQSYSMDRIFNYTPATVNPNQFPELIEKGEFTVYFYKANFTVQFYGGKNFTGYETAYVGREGLITSNTAWDREQWDGGNFSYTFSNNSQQFEFRINMTNMKFGDATKDWLKLVIGSDNNVAVNLTYPGAVDNYVVASGSYMSVSSMYSLQSYIILPFEMREAPPTTTSVSTSTTTPPSTKAPTTTIPTPTTVLTQTPTPPDICNSGAYSISTPTGVLPYQYKDLVQIPNGTVCTYNFTVPFGYALELKTDYNLKSGQDKITITNNINEQIVYNAYGATFEDTYFCPKGFCQLKVESGTGASFLTAYRFKMVSNYTTSTVIWGNWYKLSDIQPYQCIIYYCSNVVLTLAQNTNLDSMRNLKNYYVYNGPGLTSFDYIGTLDTLRNSSLYTTEIFITVVNFYDGSDSDAYVIGNTASLIPSDYTFIMTTPETMGSYQFSSFVNNEAAVTFGCDRCGRYYLTGVTFDTSVASNGYAAIQGQSPSNSLSMQRVLNYSPATVSPNLFPQLIEKNQFTVYFYKANFTIQFYGGHNFPNYETAFIGRQGLVASNTVWDRDQWDGGKFSFTFSNNSQLYEFHINMTNIYFDVNSTDWVNVVIGTGNNIAVNLTYPEANDTSAVAVGSYMFVSSVYSLHAYIILPYEIRAPPSTTTTMSTSTVTTTTKTTTTTTRPPLTTTSTTTTTSISTPSTAAPTTSVAQGSSQSTTATGTSTVATTTSGIQVISLNLLLVTFMAFIVLVF